jgi:hypothetical protein
MAGWLRFGRCGHSTHDLHKEVSECGFGISLDRQTSSKKMSEIPDMLQRLSDKFPCMSSNVRYI